MLQAFPLSKSPQEFQSRYLQPPQPILFLVGALVSCKIKFSWSYAQMYCNGLQEEVKVREEMAAELSCSRPSTIIPVNKQQ